MLSASSFSPNESRYGALVDAVPPSNLALRHASVVQLPDSTDSSIRDRSLKWHNSIGGGMEIIIQTRDPLKVSDRVICFNEVDVIDLGEIFRVENEGHRDKAMNGNSSRNPSRPETDGNISSISGMESHDAASQLSDGAAFPTARSAQTLDSSEVTDLVGSFKCGDGDWSPFFIQRDRHSTGCPSDSIGSTIKNPSRASTLGGFAIYNIPAASDQENGGFPCL